MTAGENDGPAPGASSYPFTTSDPDRAEPVLQDVYRVTGRIRISGDSDDFHYAQHVLDGDGFAVTRFQCTMTMSSRGPLGGLLCVDRVHAGRLSIRTAREELRTGAGDVCLVPPHEAWSATTDDVDLAPLTLDQAEVSAYAATLSGTEPGALAFTGVEPVSAVAARYWTAAVAHVGEDIMAEPEIAAVEFVDTNAHLPIGLAEITEAARISARGLQYLFARHRGQTSLQYLREVRMAHAHRELMGADPTRGDTVAAVAARWGFAHAGRFSAQYRRAYGRSPGATLRE